MLMPQSDRKKIYERLFEDGVCIAKKDYQLKSHPEIEGVRNLYVIKALKVRSPQCPAAVAPLTSASPPLVLSRGDYYQASSACRQSEYESRPTLSCELRLRSTTELSRTLPKIRYRVPYSFPLALPTVFSFVHITKSATPL